MPVGRIAFVDAGEPVAFEVDDYDADRRAGWSVLVRGRATLADDTDRLDGLDLDAWADSVGRDQWVAVVSDEVSGRRIPRAGG